MKKLKKIKILVIEDDVILAALLQEAVFNSDEFEFTITHSYEEAQELFACLQLKPKLFDVIVLDLKLPGGSGLDLLKGLRASGSEHPVIILSSKSAEKDRIAGLESGADDYLCKPFSLKELYIRVKKIIKRSVVNGVKDPAAKVFVSGDLTVNFNLREVFVKNSRISLTPNEFDILKYLIENKNAVIERSSLVADLWGGGFVTNSTIDSYVSRLRSKLSPCGDMIETIHGIGYKVRADD